MTARKSRHFRRNVDRNSKPSKRALAVYHLSVIPCDRCGRRMSVIEAVTYGAMCIDCRRKLSRGYMLGEKIQQKALTPYANGRRIVKTGKEVILWQREPGSTKDA